MTTRKVFTKEEMKALIEKTAESTAEKTVHRLFANLDINMNDLDDVREFRDNQRFLAQQRKGQEHWKEQVQENKVVLMFGAAVGAGWLFWDVIVAGFKAVIAAKTGM